MACRTTVYVAYCHILGAELCYICIKECVGVCLLHSKWSGRERLWGNMARTDNNHICHHLCCCTVSSWVHSCSMHWGVWEWCFILGGWRGERENMARADVTSPIVIVGPLMSPVSYFLSVWSFCGHSFNVAPVPEYSIPIHKFHVHWWDPFWNSIYFKEHQYNTLHNF